MGFAYNPAGQIVSRSVSNDADVYTPANASTAYVNDLLNRLTSINGSSVGYDGAGNLTTAPGAAYGYDAESRLTSSTTSLGSAGYAYDPVGRLYRSTGSATRRYLYDGQQVIAEYDGSGVIQNRYVPGLGLDDVVTGYDAGGNRSWLLSDERRSVIALTDGSGVTSAINTYDDYGVPGAGNAGRFQYTGQMWLTDAQIYHYRARAYAPQIGRFLQTDPMGYGAGANLYAYVGGDPVNWIDPLGLAKQCRPVKGVPCVSEVPVWGGGGLSRAFGGGMPLAGGGGGNRTVVADSNATEVDDVVVTATRIQATILENRRGERNYAGSNHGTPNPYKGFRPVPGRPGWGTQTNPQTGKQSGPKPWPTDPRLNPPPPPPTNSNIGRNLLIGGGVIVTGVACVLSGVCEAIALGLTIGGATYVLSN